MKLTKEVKIGIIAVVALLSFFWVFTFLQGKNLFTSGRVFYVKYSNVDGLLATKPVNINGLKVGAVEDIEIMEEPDSLYFVVKMVINRDIDFSKNTVAEIYEPGLMQGKMIKLNLNYNGPKAKSGDTLIAATNESLMTMLSNKLKPTQNRLDSVLITLNHALVNYGALADSTTNRSLKTVLLSLDQSIKAIEASAKSVSVLSKSTDKLIGTVNSEISDLTKTANSALATADKTLDKYGKVADRIDQSEIDQTLKNLNLATNDLKSIINRIENSDGSLNKIINDPHLYNNLESTSRKLDILIEDLQRRPDRYLQFSIFGKKLKEPIE